MDINQEIAEELSGLGMEQGLAWERVRTYRCDNGHTHDCVREGIYCCEEGCRERVLKMYLLEPLDFTQAQYLMPAVEAYLHWALMNDRQIRVEYTSSWHQDHVGTWGVSWVTAYVEYIRGEWTFLVRESCGDFGKSGRAGLHTALTVGVGE